ncbi:unnamed protein product [Moneuplotes crassus]|uniref:Uncharacterized protein n=1 Tax=Euplotes crassus TaxID=5936 RepID=A0AAD1UK57_EUPCR|nr:unnamed protein product [Moneuplotes crassus]
MNLILLSILALAALCNSSESDPDMILVCCKSNNEVDYTCCDISKSTDFTTSYMRGQSASTLKCAIVSSPPNEARYIDTEGHIIGRGEEAALEEPCGFFPDNEPELKVYASMHILIIIFIPIILTVMGACTVVCLVGPRKLFRMNLEFAGIRKRQDNSQSSSRMTRNHLDESSSEEEKQLPSNRDSLL